LYGCPYGHIFSAGDLVRRFQAQERFTYLGGLTAQRLVSRADGAEVAVARADGTEKILQADRIFVAAGMLGTAQLMLKSFFGSQDSLTFRDGQYFLLPFLAPAPRAENLHTLSQLFLELDGEVPLH